MFLSRSIRPLCSTFKFCNHWELVIRMCNISPNSTGAPVDSFTWFTDTKTNTVNVNSGRFINTVRSYCTSKPVENVDDVQETFETDATDQVTTNRASDTMETIRKNVKGKSYNPVDLATSLDYMNSSVYHNIYRGKPVWFYYRRNFKGHFPPPRTRPNCVVGKKLISSNPCPICRDEYLVLDFRNTSLLTQFINPISSNILEPSTTGLCQHQHKKLLLEVEKARDIGTIEMWIPFYLYNYRDYYEHVLDPEHLDALLKSSGYIPVDNDDVQFTSLSSATLNELPPVVQDILVHSYSTIPHAREYAPKKPETDWLRPRVPNRYKMEEEHKARLKKLRRSRTLLLDS